MRVASFVGKTIVLSAAAVLSLAACSNNPKTEQWDLYNENLDPSFRGSNAPRPAPKPEPAPVSKPAPAQKPSEPAPAPAPAMSTGNVLYIPTGERTGSGLMIEKRVPAEVVAGSEFGYDIIATNLTGSSLENVIVTDSLSPNFKLVSSDPAADMQGQTARWSLGTLAGKAVKTIHVRGNATGTGQISSCAGGSYTLALCTSINVVQPALKLTKAGPAEVLICDPIPYRLTVTNNGTGVARNVHVKDALPAGLTTADGKNSVDLDAGNLAAGQSKDFTVTVKASKTGSYTNAGTASAEGNLTAQSNQVTTVVREPKLEITCKAPNQIFIGRTATFEFTVKNTGDAACNTTVMANIPANAKFVSATDGGTAAAGGVTWNVGSLAPNATKTVAVTVSATSGSVAIGATAKCGCAKDAMTNCSTNVVGIPALLLDGFDNPDPVEVGQNVVYTLTVTNQGSANLTNVQLVCTMDDGDTMQYVSATGGTASVAGKTISFPAIATLAPGAKQTYTITIKATKAGQVQFKGEAKSTEITRPLVKIETTNFYQ